MKHTHAIITLVVLIALFVGGFIAISYQIKQKKEEKIITKVKTPPSQSFLKSEKEGIVKIINILPSKFEPSPLVIKPGEIVQVINSTEKAVNLKINMIGGVVINIPAGKNSFLTNFNQSGLYEIENSDEPNVKGKIIVE